MALDPAVLAELRSWVGTTTPTENDLETRYQRLGAVPDVALEVLRGRLADLLTNPAQFSIDGDYSENRAENLRALRYQIEQLEALVAAASDGGPGSVSTGLLVRCDRER